MKRQTKDRYKWADMALWIMRERDLPEMRGPVCRCQCHRDGDEDHHECCFYTAARERDSQVVPDVLAVHRAQMAQVLRVIDQVEKCSPGLCEDEAGFLLACGEIRKGLERL